MYVNLIRSSLHFHLCPCITVYVFQVFRYFFMVKAFIVQPFSLCMPNAGYCCLALQVSTLSILRDDNEEELEDQLFMMRQSARHVSLGLKRYFEAHLLLKCQEVQRSHARNGETLHIPETPAYKVRKMATTTAACTICQVLLSSCGIFLSLVFKSGKREG